MIGTDPYYQRTLVKDGWEYRITVDLTPMPDRTYVCTQDIRPLPYGMRWGNTGSKISFEMVEAIQADKEDYYLSHFLQDLKDKYPNERR